MAAFYAALCKNTLFEGPDFGDDFRVYYSLFFQAHYGNAERYGR